MELLKELYGWVGAPSYPRLAAAIVALICAGLGAAAWCFIGWQYAKDHVQTSVAPTQKPKVSEEKADLANYKATLDQAREALDKLEGEFSPQELAQANQGLEKGDPSNAEALFQRILISGSTVSVVGSKEKAFTAALMLAQLAQDGNNDPAAASRYYKQAMQLKPSGDTVQSHGWVGDDTRKVIVALRHIRFSGRTVSGIYATTKIDESIIEEKLRSLETNGFVAKSETDPPYWSLTLKGREAFADLQ